MALLINRIQITDANQHVLPVQNQGLQEVRQLLALAKGRREFVYLRIVNLAGKIDFYLNEVTAHGLEVIADDQLFEELSAIIDSHHHGIKPEGSDI